MPTSLSGQATSFVLDLNNIWTLNQSQSLMAMIEELGIQREERTGAFPKLAENKQIKFRASLKMGNS